MKKYFLTTIFIALSMIVIGQAVRVTPVKIATKAEAFGINLASGSLVWQTDSLTMYVLTATFTSTDSMSTVFRDGDYEVMAKSSDVQIFKRASARVYPTNSGDSLSWAGDVYIGGTLKVDGAAVINGATFTSSANTFNITRGTASLDIAAAAAVNIDNGFTVNGGQTTTITSEDAAGVITLDEQTFEVEGEGTATQLFKLINAENAARTVTFYENLTVGNGNAGTITYTGASKTLSVEDNAVVNQDLTSDAAVTFAGITITAEINKTTTVTGDQTFTNVVPANYLLEYMIIQNTTANTCWLDLGTTAGAYDVFQQQTITASAITTISVSKVYNLASTAKTLYLNDDSGGSYWNSASLTVIFVMKKIN